MRRPVLYRELPSGFVFDGHTQSQQGGTDQGHVQTARNQVEHIENRFEAPLDLGHAVASLVGFQLHERLV